VGDLVRPDNSERTGQLAKAAPGALFHIKYRAFAFFMQSPAKADHGAASLLTVMAEYGNRSLISYKMHINVSAASVHALASHLARAASNASADVNVNGHLGPVRK